jgi:hypothetical protein
MIFKRLAFIFLCLLSCILFYYLIGVSFLMSTFLADGDTSVLRWGAVIAINVFILILVWRRMKSAYQSLWLSEKRKEKPKIEYAEPHEIADTEEADTFLAEQQSSRKSHP